MSELAKLHEEGRRLISEELMTGKLARPTAEHLVGLVEPFERKVSLEALDEAVERVILRTQRFDTEVDAIAAPAFHQALRLTRREASDPAVWRFLAVVHRPDFVRHRWEYRSRATMTTRFWAPGTRPDSNAFSRLWWIAELSCEGDDYRLTSRVLALQTIANSLFVRPGLSSYRPALEAFLDVFEKRTAEEVERGIRELRAALSTVPVEGQSFEALRATLRRIRDRN